MADIVVGQTPIATVKWFSGPNGTGTQIIPAQASAWTSSNPADLTAVSTGLETAQLDALAPGTVTLSAADPGTGVVATLPIVIAPLPIVSGVITLS